MQPEHPSFLENHDSRSWPIGATGHRAQPPTPPRLRRPMTTPDLAASSSPAVAHRCYGWNFHTSWGRDTAMISCVACLSQGPSLPAPTAGQPRNPQAHSSGRMASCPPKAVKLCTLAATLAAKPFPCSMLPAACCRGNDPQSATRMLLPQVSASGPLHVGHSAARRISSRSAGRWRRRRRRRQRLARNLVGAPMCPLALAGTVPRLAAAAALAHLGGRQVAVEAHATLEVVCQHHLSGCRHILLLGLFRALGPWQLMVGLARAVQPHPDGGLPSLLCRRGESGGRHVVGGPVLGYQVVELVVRPAPHLARRLPTRATHDARLLLPDVAKARDPGR